MKCDKDLNALAPSKSARPVVNKDPYFFNCPVIINHFVCFTRGVYLQTEKINPALRISEDQDPYLKMYEKCDVKFINDTNYLYRTHAGGISQNENKGKSYEYWAKVIWNALQRRGLKNIHFQRIPEKFTGSEEVFRLIEYQNSFFYRLRRKISKLFYRLLS